MRLSSVRTRLTLWSVGVLALALIAFGVALRSFVQVSINAAINRELMRQARGHQEMTERLFELRPDGFGPFGPGDLGHPPPGPGLGGFDHYFRGGPQGLGRPKPPRPPNFGLSESMPPRVLDLHERSLAGWSASMPWDPDTFPQSVRGHEVYSTPRVGPQDIRVLSVPLLSHGRVVGVVQTAAYLTEANAELAHLTRALLTLIPLVLLIAGVGGACLTGGTLRPIRAITQAANRIEAQDLSGRLAVSGDDEFSELAATFNGMLARLEGAFRKLTVAYEQERRFTADASHELRTPLTVIKAHTSLALESLALDWQPSVAEYRESMEAIDEAVDQTNRLVQSLLLLARSDAGRLALCLGPVSLPDVGRRAAQAAARVDVSVSVCIPEDFPPVQGDAEALLQVFTNLLANAVRHTGANGEVTLTAREGDADVTVTVADTGEGIAAEHLPHLFERFYRVESSRSRGKGGTGLGLAICREIVHAHGGSIAVDSVIGLGTTVSVTLPRLQPAP